MQVDHYLTADGRDLFERWLDRVRDRRALVAIERRLARIERDGYLGDHKFLRDGVSELRIDVGAGYRVYYAEDGKTILLLLCGGDKSTQETDIDRAVACWEEFQKRRRA
jgi:putative addiction module killer protein